MTDAAHREPMHLSGADAFTVHLEHDPLLRSTIVAMVVFDRCPDWSRLCDAVERASRLEPSFRRCIIESGSVEPPRWVDDVDFDLAYHLRRIAAPAPRTLDEVVEYARVTGMTAFDPARPRWEFTLVEDLADGRAALVMKVHHALTDGIGGIQLAQHVVDLDRRGRRRRPVAEPTPRSDSVAARANDLLTVEAGRISSTLASALRSATTEVVRRPLRLLEDAGRLGGSVIRFVRPITTTMSPVMTARRPVWHYDRLEVPFAGLHDAARHADATVNDAFLAAIAGGLARYHAAFGSTVEELRVTMPVSTRTADDPEGGNRVSLVRFTLPVGEPDPTCRMMSIDHTAQQIRLEPAIGWSQSIAGALNLLPTAIAGEMLKHVDVLASNVPGFDVAVFVAGAKVEQFVAFGPPMGASANITLMSYAGRCFVGVTTDAGAVPDHDRFTECLAAGFDEVLAVSRSGPTAARGAPPAQAEPRGSSARRASRVSASPGDLSSR